MARKYGRRWQADIRLKDGTRLRPTFPTQEAAELWENKAKDAVKMGKPLPATQPKGSTDLTILGNLYEFVCRTEWDACRAASTLKRNGYEACIYYGTEKPISEITCQSIAEYKLALAEKGNAPATVNRKLAALSKMLHVAEACDALAKVPKIKRNPEEQTKVRYLDELEERALLSFWEAQGYPDLKDLCVMLIDTGARLNEMLSAKWDAFESNLKQITFWRTKSNKARTVPLTARAQAIIKRRKLTHGAKPSPFSGFKKNALRSRWDVMRENLGLQDVTPHTLRHTCCTRLILNGADARRVKEWMGHASIVTTMRYMQIRPTSLEEIVHILEGKPRFQQPNPPQ